MFAAVAALLLALTVWGGEGVPRVFSRFGDTRALRRENEALQNEINALRAGQAERDILRRENERYRAMLEIKEQHPTFRFADARVIAVDPANGFGAFTLNGGSEAGVAVGNPVVTPAGMVGVVCRVTPTTATVRTVLDPQTPVAVCISRTGDSGITAGNAALAADGLLRVERLDRTADVAVGDYVVTYGGGYPAGLLLGEITAVYPETDGLSLAATVRPFAPITDLAEVFVIVD